MLNVTQAAVSQYVRGSRGGTIDLREDQDIYRIIKRIAKGLVNGDLSRREISILVCEACYLARKKRIICGAIGEKYADIKDLVCFDYDFSRDREEIRKLISNLLADVQ